MAPRTLVIGALACSVMAAATGMLSCEAEQPADAPVRLKIGGETFSLETALDEASRVKGFSGREKVAPEGGMIFVFREPQLLSFWMYDCITDIDAAFLDDAGRIVAIHQMKAEPARKPEETEDAYRARLKMYPSRFACRFVIELAPGTFKRLGIKEGDLITLPVDDLKRRAR